VADLIVVANRGPSVSLSPDGTPIVASSAGGVSPSLQRALQLSGGGQWICAAQHPDEHTLAGKGVPASVNGVDVTFVSVPDAVTHAAVGVIANRTLWFLNHNLYDPSRRPVLDRHWHQAWEGYRSYNAAFVDRIVTDAPEGATVVVNDYHLALVGSELRQRRPDLASILFFHTPFAAPEELRILPHAVRSELLASMASFGAVGFHVERWADAFRRCARAEGFEPSIVLAPLGVDPESLAELANSPEVRARRGELRTRLDGRQLIARSDRVELSKNLIRGFLAFAELLEAEPARRGRVLFAARVYASRTDIAEYLAYANDLHRIVDRINERHSIGELAAIELDVADDLAGSFALLSENDALLVNPVRDGMNLVAKEGPLLNERNGVLLLSQEAGAFDELGDDSLAIEPFDVTGTARVIARALDMEPPERASRAAALRTRAPGLGPHQWLERVAAGARVPRSN